MKMALEDRCSPQSAAGVPHSPQNLPNSNTTAASMLMLINNVIDTKTKLMESYCNSDSSDQITPSQLLSTLASKNLFNMNQLNFPEPMQAVKSEDESKEDEDEEDEIDIENDTPKISSKNSVGSLLIPSPTPSCSSNSPKSPNPSATTTTTASANLKFSISQILSDNFGSFDARHHLHQHQQQQSKLKLASHAHHHHHHPLLFRPYDMDELRNSSQKLKNNFSNLFNSFQASSKKLEEFCDSKLSSNSNNGLPNHRGSGPKSALLEAASISRQSTHTPSSYRPDSAGLDSSDDTRSESGGSTKEDNGQALWPAWVYCTRYSDRPSSGPRYRRPKKPKDKTTPVPEDKRPRTAFSNEQLARLKREFNENRYLNERRRQELSAELGLNEAQIKIWFQNKRAKIKKSSGQKNPLALQLMAQGLYNHTTVPLTKEEEELEMRMNGQLFD